MARFRGTLWILSCLLVLLANADSIQIAKQLANNPVLRQAMVLQAEQVVADHKAGTGDSNNPAKEFEDYTAKVMATSELGLPLGWQDDGFIKSLGLHGWKSWQVSQVWVALLSKCAGLLITILAASLGAPFWFDMLNRIMSVRSVGKSPRESAEAKS